jgi:hypothetical protein
MVSTDRELPPIGTTVVAVCESFTTMAYRDASGIWRETKSRRELPYVLGWMEFSPGNLHPGRANRTDTIGRA